MLKELQDLKELLLERGHSKQAQIIDLLIKKSRTLSPEELRSRKFKHVKDNLSDALQFASAAPEYEKLIRQGFTAQEIAHLLKLFVRDIGGGGMLTGTEFGRQAIALANEKGLSLAEQAQFSRDLHSILTTMYTRYRPAEEEARVPVAKPEGRVPVRKEETQAAKGWDTYIERHGEEGRSLWQTWTTLHPEGFDPGFYSFVRWYNHEKEKMGRDFGIAEAIDKLTVATEETAPEAIPVAKPEEGERVPIAEPEPPVELPEATLEDVRAAVIELLRGEFEISEEAIQRTLEGEEVPVTIRGLSAEQAQRRARRYMRKLQRELESDELIYSEILDEITDTKMPEDRAQFLLRVYEALERAAISPQRAGRRAGRVRRIRRSQEISNLFKK